eukprot:3932907-Rhodomonas_salina.1
MAVTPAPGSNSFSSVVALQTRHNGPGDSELCNKSHDCLQVLAFIQGQISLVLAFFAWHLTNQDRIETQAIFSNNADSGLRFDMMGADEIGTTRGMELS